MREISVNRVLVLREGHGDPKLSEAYFKCDSFERIFSSTPCFTDEQTEVESAWILKPGRFGFKPSVSKLMILAK